MDRGRKGLEVDLALEGDWVAMKVVIATVLMLLAFFIGALVFMNFVRVSCDKLLSQAEELERALADEDWENAGIILLEIKESWTSLKHILELYIEHYDMDRAELAMAKMKEYIEGKEKTLLIGEAAELKFIIELIKKKEALKLSNLL
jgi:hypothetical protein